MFLVDIMMFFTVLATAAMHGASDPGPDSIAIAQLTIPIVIL